MGNFSKSFLRKMSSVTAAVAAVFVVVVVVVRVTELPVCLGEKKGENANFSWFWSSD